MYGHAASCRAVASNDISLGVDVCPAASASSKPIPGATSSSHLRSPGQSDDKVLGHGLAAARRGASVQPLLALCQPEDRRFFVGPQLLAQCPKSVGEWTRAGARQGGSQKGHPHYRTGGGAGAEKPVASRPLSTTTMGSRVIHDCVHLHVHTGIHASPHIMYVVLTYIHCMGRHPPWLPPGAGRGQAHVDVDVSQSEKGLDTLQCTGSCAAGPNRRPYWQTEAQDRHSRSQPPTSTGVDTQTRPQTSAKKKPSSLPDAKPPPVRLPAPVHQVEPSTQVGLAHCSTFPRPARYSSRAGATRWPGSPSGQPLAEASCSAPPPTAPPPTSLSLLSLTTDSRASSPLPSPASLPPFFHF
ncbi:hypothetical protein CDD82_6995 [Ophiocordyceps australis]|uniref:Uncharacterized protein n=1 Tax=Ophiocordyceps australis TaxID=1399860 RepID=A0A2C5YUG2_9HYPO|nr:hypothetical protein CDD82_6995 [Ophiocordyceps australis]